MVNWTTALSAGSLALSLKEYSDHQQMREQLATDGAGQQGAPASSLEAEAATAENTRSTERKLEKLLEIERKRDVTPGDKDAYVSATISLNAGETAEVTAEPQDGWHLRVKEIHFDRRDSHSYEINVAGDVTSVSHRARYMSPKKVAQSDRVLATVTNNSGSTTTVDFEMQAWAERPRRS